MLQLFFVCFCSLITKKEKVLIFQDKAQRNDSKKIFQHIDYCLQTLGPLACTPYSCILKFLNIPSHVNTCISDIRPLAYVCFNQKIVTCLHICSNRKMPQTGIFSHVCSYSFQKERSIHSFAVSSRSCLPLLRAKWISRTVVVKLWCKRAKETEWRCMLYEVYVGNKHF